MPNYRRLYIPGGTYFFTVNLQRRRSTILVDRIQDLRCAIAEVRRDHAFRLWAMVVLPDHFHCIMALPLGDADFSTRIKKIKAGFSSRVPPGESVSASRTRKGERGIWQRRFHEHAIRDESDLENHVNYIHFNPVKHGYVKRPTDWEYSSIHRFIEHGWRPPNWGIGGFAWGLDYEE